MAENDSRFNGGVTASEPAAEPPGAAGADTAEIRALPEAQPPPLGEAEYVDELAETGEFPPLVLDAPTDAPRTTAEERASYALTHLESEVSRLHARWERVETELRSREATIDELVDAAKARDATITALRDEVAARETERQASATALDQANVRIEELASLQRNLQSTLDQRDTDLAGRQEELETAEKRLAEAGAEIGHLTSALEEQRIATRERAEREAMHQADVNELRRTIQALETYIDGRKRNWAELNSKLAEYQDTAVRLEHGLADRDSQLSSAATAKLALEDEVAALKQHAASLDQLLLDREEAHRRTETDLKAQASATARLTSELDAVTQQRDDASGRLAGTQETVAALEATIERQDRETNELRDELADSQREKEQLRTAERALTTRIAELEATILERESKIAALLDANAAVETALGTAEKRVEKLERLLSDAGKEMAELQDSLVAEERRVARLKQQVRDKQQALDLLERSAQRLDDLGASLEGFDRRFSGPAAKVLSANLQVADPHIEQLPPRTNQRPVSTERRRMIVALDSEDRASYPLRGSDVTIGRSAESDIRLRSPFISRLHARISVRGSDTLIEDLGSKNGVMLNSAPIGGSATLHDGDIISLGGRLDLKYVDRDEPIADVPTHMSDLPHPPPDTP